MQHSRALTAWLLASLFAIALPRMTLALTIPGADGSDGVFAPDADVEVDLSLAPTAAWDSPGNGNGVYDPDKWAVVFKYRSVQIPAGVTVTFKNHPSGAPVVWLVSSDVNIAGILSLNGQNYVGLRVHAAPGPGGFAGGVANQSAFAVEGGGLGIGGGLASFEGGSHATSGQGNPSPTYGNPRILPLVGGSGGGGEENGGGGGGGAILVAAGGTLTVDGLIKAAGGNGRNDCCYHRAGSGAGGAVRLVADALAGAGRIYALGGLTRFGGEGRIRLEAVQTSATWDLQPVTTLMTPDNPVLLWPPDDAPTVRLVSIGGHLFPADPGARLDPGREDITMDLAEAQQIVLETANVDPAASVQVRVTPEHGAPLFIDAVFQSGNRTLATWTATADLPDGYLMVQAHAVNPAP